MANSYITSTNELASGITGDGLILSVASGDLGNANTSYTYFLLGGSGYDAFSLDFVITATTLTLEGSNDNLNIADEANELNTTTNNRTFAGAGNWEADGTGASVAVNAGALDVTAGVALSGAKLGRAYFNDGKGFQIGKKYTVTLTISALSGGTVSVYAGSQLIASGLTDGAAQTITFTKITAVGDKLSIVASDAAATFSLDDVLIQDFAATWTDLTSMLTAGVASSFTSTGSYTTNSSVPWSRMRIKRVTTNATNALQLRMTRMREGGAV